MLAGARTGNSVRALPTGSLFAIQFLTILPPLVRRTPTSQELGAAGAFFPLVGLLLGLALVGLDLLLGSQFQSNVRAALLVVALAVATGALHLDGVVDTFDGAFGGGDAATRLEVMRDPRAGAFGVVGLVCLMLVKVAALEALPEHLRSTAIIIGPCLGRWAIVQAMWSFPYARRDGLGRAFKEGLGWTHVAVAGLTVVAAASFLLGVAGLGLLLAGVGGGWLASRLLASRLGGLTGDTYGSLCELVETGAWLVLGSRLLAGYP